MRLKHGVTVGLGVALVLLSLLFCSSCKRKKRPRGPWVVGVTMVEPAAPATQVQQYTKLELVIDIEHAWITNPYNAEPASGGIDIQALFVGPGGSYWVPAFYDGTDFRVRFAPMRPGYWTYSIKATDVNGGGGWSLGSFTCVASALPGFARTAGRYFQTSDGNLLFPIGHNNGWQIDVEQPSLAAMAAAGENVLSFWQNTPWVKESDPDGHRAPLENIETGPGRYNLKACAYLDGLVARAEAGGVFLQPALWSHGGLRTDGNPWPEGWWDNNAYSAVCATPTEFFRRSEGGKKTQQWRNQKNFIRYVFARWGYSRAILNWIAVVEVNGTTGYTDDPALVIDWLQGVQAEFTRWDFYRGAGAAPVTAFASDDATFDPGMTLRSVDTYQANGQGGAFDNYTVAALIASHTFTMRATPKPCFHGEFGADLSYATATQPAHGHNGIWSGVSSGAAMAPFLWCDGGNFPMLTDPAAGGLQTHYTQLAQFLNDTPYLGSAALVSQPLVPQVGSVTRLTDRGFGWAMYIPFIPGLTTFQVTGVASGTYTVEWYNVWTNAGTPALTQSIPTVGGNLVLDYPPALAPVAPDLAFRFQRTGALITSAPMSAGHREAAVIAPTAEGHDGEEATDEDSPSGSGDAGDAPTPPPQAEDTSKRF